MSDPITPVAPSWRSPPPQRQQVRGHAPCGRIGEPEDLVMAITAFCAADGEWINSHLDFADGGFL
ncbi:NAD(P)-binding domain-containing protein (plasmid) [Rhizobium etli 8C-3]|uniref:NAD(P)-binding domain-containing protein n=1 Tax=Rhizobium etli 8C-3 TaxID=538025 RepID=A0A1L5PA39_RHIET|nr:hypothetical protein [Rhizobium etli]APO76943.1 NAD(P)-binding domain-containing protein [Rhizobium etli 8C-3]